MHQVLGRVAGEGKITIFFPVVLPPVVSSPASPSSGASVQLRWAKAWPCHSGCPGEVKVVVEQLQLAGHSERRCVFVRVHGQAAVVARAQLEERVSSLVLL